MHILLYITLHIYIIYIYYSFSWKILMCPPPHNDISFTMTFIQHEGWAIRLFNGQNLNLFTSATCHSHETIIHLFIKELLWNAHFLLFIQLPSNRHKFSPIFLYTHSINLYSKINLTIGKTIWSQFPHNFNFNFKSGLFRLWVCKQSPSNTLATT